MERYEVQVKKSDNLNERQQKLHIAKQEVNHLIDKLGMGIDDGIKETIVILRAMGFPTSSSCSGHTEDIRHSPPYVEIYAEAPNGWKESKAKQEAWKFQNIQYQNQMDILLKRFYKSHDTDIDCQLHISNIGIFGGFRIQCEDAHPELNRYIPKSLDCVIKKIKSYQKEMNDFTKFLERDFSK